MSEEQIAFAARTMKRLSSGTDAVVTNDGYGTGWQRCMKAYRRLTSRSVQFPKMIR